MKVTKTNLDNAKFKLAIVADQSELTAIKNATLKHLGVKHVKLAGFRAGKAPLNLIEKNVDPNLLQSEFLEEAVNRLCLKAIQAEKLRAIGQPNVNLKKFVPFTQLEFEAELEAVGHVELGSYKSIKIAKVKVLITAKDVSEVLDRLKKQLAERKPTDKPAENGDEIIIDFKGMDSKNKPVNGADGQDYPLILGSNAFIPGFEPELIALKVGQSKKFAVTFPADYGLAPLRSKKVTFSVTAKKVNKIVEPKLDDVFAAKAGPFKSLVELKADIKRQVGLERQQQADKDYEDKLIKSITDKSKVVIPETLIDEQVQQAEEQERQNLAYRSQTWQEHLDEEGISEVEHRKRNRPEATYNIKAGLVLSEIAEREGIKVSEEELAIRIQLLKGQYQDPQMQAELDKADNQRDVANRILTEKTIAKIVQYNHENN